MTQHIIDTDQLEPCPFCGSHNISIGEVAGNHLDGTYFVQTACMNCGALSPEAKTETESVELWNRRKANSPQADDEAKHNARLLKALRTAEFNGINIGAIVDIVEAKIKQYDEEENTPANDSRPSLNFEFKADDGRKDAERLDWIEANFTGLSDSERYLPFRLYWGKGNNKTLRQAIDQARDKAR